MPAANTLPAADPHRPERDEQPDGGSVGRYRPSSGLSDELEDCANNVFDFSAIDFCVSSS